MRNQPVHGVKGELLARNRSLIPLAGSRRECWFFFPRCADSATPPAVQEPPLRLYVFLRCIAAWLHQIGSHKPRIQHHFRPSPSGRCRIPSLEPSFTGAGKEAAYAGRARLTAEAFPAACRALRSAVCRLDRRAKARCERAKRHCKADEHSYRNRVSCVKQSVRDTSSGKTNTQAKCERAAVRLKKGRQRPLEGLTCSPRLQETRNSRTKNKKGGRQRRTDNTWREVP